MRFLRRTWNIINFKYAKYLKLRFTYKQELQNLKYSLLNSDWLIAESVLIFILSINIIECNMFIVWIGVWCGRNSCVSLGVMLSYYWSSYGIIGIIRYCVATLDVCKVYSFLNKYPIINYITKNYLDYFWSQFRSFLIRQFLLTLITLSRFNTYSLNWSY